MEKKHEIIPYEVGDVVRVQQTCTEEEDSESFYYIQQFEKKKGEVIEVIHHATSTISCKIWTG